MLYFCRPTHSNPWPRNEDTCDGDCSINGDCNGNDNPTMFNDGPFHFSFSFGHPDDSDMFQHTDDMFRHFDEMFRSFDEAFRSMGHIEFAG